MSRVIQEYRVVKDPGHPPVTVYTHSVTLGGKRYASNYVVPFDGIGNPPMDYVDHALRRQLMAGIEADIYGSCK